MRIAFLFPVVWYLFCGVGTAVGQPVLLTRAHAHNDYEHARPLLDALDHGFRSVEADIHLVDGQLLVGHDPEDLDAGRTLDSLYLAPLRARVGKNGGRVYPEGPPLLLLVDVKTDAEATYARLRPLLHRYAGMLTRFEGNEVTPGAVTVILSGNRPRTILASEPLRFAAFDGRLDDLNAPDPAPASFMPLVSAPWSAVAAWYGDGPFPDDARKRLNALVAKAHAQHRLLRFWATGDRPVVWEVLYDAGVDLLNADDLEALRTFLLERDDR